MRLMDLLLACHLQKISTEVMAGVDGAIHYMKNGSTWIETSTTDINKLKKVTFYESLGTVYNKTQRLRKMAYFISDQLDLSKEKVEIAASVSKSDLVSGLVGEFPELQGVMGKYFALNQGFEEDVSNAVSDHYLPLGNNSMPAKKPISYTVAITDKIDTLVGFFLINEIKSHSFSVISLLYI